jgi:hypothetical protein
MDKSKTSSSPKQNAAGEYNAAESKYQHSQPFVSDTSLGHSGYAPAQLPAANHQAHAATKVLSHHQDMSVASPQLPVQPMGHRYDPPAQSPLQLVGYQQSLRLPPQFPMQPMSYQNGMYASPAQSSMQPMPPHTSGQDTQVPNAFPPPFTTNGSQRQQDPPATSTVPRKARKAALASDDPNKSTRLSVLTQFPEHAYVMPSGPHLSFTMADILVILPNWYKNTRIMARFMNNGFNSMIHAEILQEYRTLNTPEEGLGRFRDALSAQYRRTMRMIDPGWTKANHKEPNHWDKINLGVNNFSPDDAANPKFRAPAPIPFTALMAGITKLPQGYDAGDLTRALDFAVSHPKKPDGSPWMFPTDIHAILGYIGYTRITDYHIDSAFDRYQKTSKTTAAERKRPLEQPGEPPNEAKRQQLCKPDTAHAPVQINACTDAAGYDAWFADVLDAYLHPHTLQGPNIFPVWTEGMTDDEWDAAFDEYLTAYWGAPEDNAPTTPNSNGGAGAVQAASSGVDEYPGAMTSEEFEAAVNPREDEDGEL